MNRYIPRKKPDLPKPTQVTSIKVLVESVSTKFEETYRLVWGWEQTDGNADILANIGIFPTSCMPYVDLISGIQE